MSAFIMHITYREVLSDGPCFCNLAACFNAPRAFDGYSNARSRVQGEDIDWEGLISQDLYNVRLCLYSLTTVT